MATGLFNLKQVNQAISQGAWSGYIAPKWVEYLVVAGGGGAGVSGGGGGGGGLLTGIVTVTAGTSYTVTVGSGGAGGTSAGTPGSSGVASVFGSLSVAGGGGGGSFNSGATTGNSGLSGGSGGGGASGYTSINAGTAGQGTANQGNAGNVTGGSIGQPYSGSGGGGAGTIGLSGISNGVSGNGGAGIASAISGTVTAYAGGGAGGAAGSAASPNGIGGVGGGGSAQSTTYTASGYSGSSSLGGGGGGGWGASGGAGGSGIVVVRYPGSVQFFTGGTLSYANGYMIHTFYSSGTLAPTTPTPYVTDYQISRSLRFNSDDSAYLTRTPASSGNRKTWTLSAWVKRGSVSTNQYFISNLDTGGASGLGVQFVSDGTLHIFDYGASNYVYELQTTAVYRDPSAWYHFVIAFDTTQTTSSSRVKLYVNNVQQTAFSISNYPTQNYDGYWNNTSLATISRPGGLSTQYFNGYVTEVNFIDGQALTPSSFGYTNPNTGVWSPLAFVGTYGTNGFYLNFSDNSNTTAATLGKDYSGNGNNWIPNNFSVTAGAGNDSLVDSPTSYGTDTGVGGTVRGNYCTLNPLSPPASGSPSYANGNLDGGVASYQSLVSTFSMTSGQWYWEVTPTGNSGSAGYFVAVSDANYPMSTRTWQGANFWGYYQTGSKYTNGGSASYGASFTTNDVIGVALDMDAGTVTFYKNGVSQGVAYSSLTGKSMQATVGDGTSTSIQYFSCNFGQRPFAYTAPSGFKALCTQNLPTPTIGATSTTLAGKYFNPVLWTGNGSTQTISGVGFQPDFTWAKCRSNGSTANILQDVIRGAGSTLFSEDTSGQLGNSGDLITSWNSDGFGVNRNFLGGTTNNSTNGSGYTYVAWNWKANGSGSTNTAGSITSTVSANTTSGFSIVTYTGNGSLNATFGHGLGVVPSMIIVKSRSNANAWPIYHSALGANKYIYLNLTQAPDTVGGLWGASGPSSSLVYLPTSTSQGEANGSGTTYVAYCFAEVAGYSKFGSYTGNGSTDGPFVFTGMRPAYVMFKRTDASSNWYVFDVARNTSNVMSNFLCPNDSLAETSVVGIDFLSNGFKQRGTAADYNASGGTYIYMAFASNPFKYSLAR